MTDQRRDFTDTIDWDEYWRDWTEDEHEEYTASVSGGHFERLDRFFEHVGVPDDAAFVGCGPSSLSVMVATAYPQMQVVGYDAAKPVIERNCEEYADLSNISFRQAVLPNFEVNRQFGLVFCYATLHYVRESESAIENLYERVCPGGQLIFNYPNKAYQESHQDAEGQLRERLQLPIEGENLLSREGITDVLDVDVRDFWNFVDAEGPFVRPSNPCVIVGK